MFSVPNKIYERTILAYNLSFLIKYNLVRRNCAKPVIWEEKSAVLRQLIVFYSPTLMEQHLPPSNQQFTSPNDKFNTIILILQHFSTFALFKEL